MIKTFKKQGHLVTDAGSCTRLDIRQCSVYGCPKWLVAKWLGLGVTVEVKAMHLAAYIRSSLVPRLSPLRRGRAWYVLSRA